MALRLRTSFVLAAACLWTTSAVAQSPRIFNTVKQKLAAGKQILEGRQRFGREGDAP